MLKCYVGAYLTRGWSCKQWIAYLCRSALLADHTAAPLVHSASCKQNSALLLRPAAQFFIRRAPILAATNTHFILLDCTDVVLGTSLYCWITSFSLPPLLLRPMTDWWRSCHPKELLSSGQQAKLNQCDADGLLGNQRLFLAHKYPSWTQSVAPDE